MFNGKTWLFVLFLGSLLFAVSCKKKPKALDLPYMSAFKSVGQDAFLLTFLSSIEGYVEPCGCTSNPLGGLARFSAIFKDAKEIAQNNIGLIATGNLLFETKTRNDADLCQDNEKIDLLLTTLTKLGLNTNLTGPLDLSRGKEFLASVYKKYELKALNPIGTIDAQHAPTSFLHVISAKGYEIGVIGVSSDIAMSPAELKKNVGLMADAMKAKKIKATFAISQMPLALTKEVFFELKGIDFVIQGQVDSPMPSVPKKLGEHGPILIEGGRQGQYFTALALENLSQKTTEPIALDMRSFEKAAREELLIARIEALKNQIDGAKNERFKFLNQRIDLAKNELAELKKSDPPPPLLGPHVSLISIPLTKKVDPDPAVKAKMLAYNDAIPLLAKKCEEHIQCPKAAANEPTFVGANVCKNCHLAAFEVWQNAVYFTKGLDDDGKEITRSTGHSKAWKTLTDANKDADRSCVACHSVGFMEKGGYCKVFDVDFRKNVQCESCHGAGSLHAQAGDKHFIKRQVPEQTCRNCHQVPHIDSYDSFDYEEKLIKILGKGHGDKLLEQLTHKAKTS